MPIDPSRALGAEIASITSSWSPDDVILYHLGLGAGIPATDPIELAYCYEANLKVLPSFGVIAAQPALGGMMNVPGLEFNPALLLHGEQDLEVKATLPIAAEVTTSGRVTAHLLIPGFTYTGMIARFIPEKPASAWTPEQVVDYLLEALARDEFYVLCPDNETTREQDEKRILWAAGDLVENRPALSRWHPDYEKAFEEFVK